MLLNSRGSKHQKMVFLLGRVRYTSLKYIPPDPFFKEKVGGLSSISLPIRVAYLCLRVHGKLIWNAHYFIYKLALFCVLLGVEVRRNQVKQLPYPRKNEHLFCERLRRDDSFFFVLEGTIFS
jgi:hypothetical protein